MNGITNIIAALILGGAIIWGVHTYQSGKSAGEADISAKPGMSAVEIEAFKAQTLAQVRSEMESQCAAQVAAAASSCDSERLGAIDLDQGISAEETGMGGAETYEANPRTAVLAAEYGGDENEQNEQADENIFANQSAPIDKPDSKNFYTEDQPMPADSPTAGLVDKPDSKNFFTEERRTDGSSPTAGLVDKPDDGKFFTENTPMPEPGPCQIDPETGIARPFIDPVTGLDLCVTTQTQTATYDYPPETPDPCVRADGNIYTGPGTAQDPYAPGDPCVTKWREAEDQPREEEPEQTAELPPYIPPLPPVPDAPIETTTQVTNWVSPYTDYTLPWITGGYPGPMPTVGGGSDYRPQICSKS